MADKLDQRRADRWEKIYRMLDKYQGLKGVTGKAQELGQGIDEAVYKGLEKVDEKTRGWIEKEMQKSNLSPYMINYFTRILGEPIGIDNPYWQTSKYANYPNWYKEKEYDKEIKKIEAEKKAERKERTKEITERYIKALKGKTVSKGNDLYKNKRGSGVLEDYDIPVF